MTNKNERPVEEELRSSQVYRTLTGSGIPLAGKLAQGLGKAAQGVDSALTGVFPVVKKAARSRAETLAPVPELLTATTSGFLQSTPRCFSQ